MKNDSVHTQFSKWNDFRFVLGKYKYINERINSVKFDKRARYLMSNQEHTKQLYSKLNGIRTYFKKRPIYQGFSDTMKNDIQTNDVCYMINGEPVKFYYDHEDEGYHICGQWNGSNITELYIPDTINGKPVVWVDGDTYDCMVKLERIVVSREHRHFTTVDGALLSKDMKTLFWYPTKRKDKVYFVPQGVIHIGDSALSNPFVETIVLPEGTEWVYSYGIAGARNLTELYVPVSMKQFMFLFGRMKSNVYQI